MNKGVLNNRHRFHGAINNKSEKPDFRKNFRARSSPSITVALAGNPNAGKTSIFNAITGQHQHIGNYPGVTVDKKSGSINYKGLHIEIIDLPGTYSLSAYSLEEIVTRDFILHEKPDLIVDVIDSSNLERNLYLCLQFQELGVPIIGALNMNDELERKGKYIDEKQLSTILGIPFVKTVGTSNKGISQLLDLIVEFADGKIEKNYRTVNYGRELESEKEFLIELISEDLEFSEKYAINWIAIKLLEDDKDAESKLLKEHRNGQDIIRSAERSRNRILKHFREDSVVVVSEQRYAYIYGAIKETLKVIHKANRISKTEIIDRVVLHRYAGVFIFFLVMFLVYQVTFAIGNPLSDILGKVFDDLNLFIHNTMTDGALEDLLADGIVGGVGGVLVFFPIVLMLFLGLSILEDSGYMSRAAFVMDKFFHIFGMHGRSFIPFMIATGCAVPAIMAARNLVNPRDRKITILVTPLLVCGAKSPVIAMLAAAFFPENAALIFWLVWLAGWFIAFFLAFIFRKTIFQGEAAPFVMELPPYRTPTLRGIFQHMWDKSFAYVRKAGTIILAISVIIWFLLYFPKPESYSVDYGAEAEKINLQYSNRMAEIRESGSNHKDQINNLEERRNEAINQLESRKSQETILHSYAGRMGKFIEPAIKPAGFDWKVGIALFGGLAAKEVIISTMGIVYGIGEADPDTESSSHASTPLKQVLVSDPAYNPAMALSLMFFVLIYVPCAATLAIVKKELGSWKYSFFLAGYTLFIAWLISVAVFQISRLFGL